MSATEEMTGTKKEIKVKDLSPETRALVETKKVAGQKRLKDWLRLLREAAYFDEVEDEIRARAKKRRTIFLVLFIVGIFGFFFSAGSGIVPLILLVLVADIVFFVLMIVYWLRKRRLTQADLANDFREALVPFLITIAEDIPAKDRIGLKLDLAGPVKEKIVKTQELPPGRFKKLVETIYADPWCQLEAELADGTYLGLTIENTYISFDRYWKNPRGKSKHKKKWKKLIEVYAEITPNSQLVELDRGEIQALDKKHSQKQTESDTRSAADKEKFKVVDKGTKQEARLTQLFKFKSEGEPPEISLNEQDLLGLYFQLGKLLNPARARSV